MENESKARKPTGTRYSDEVRRRAVRMVFEHQHEYQTQGGRSRALYQSVAEIDNGPLIEAFGRRVDAATTAMFVTSDAIIGDLATVNLTLATTIFGTV